VFVNFTFIQNTIPAKQLLLMSNKANNPAAALYVKIPLLP